MIQIFQSDILKLKSIAVNFLPVITAFEIVLIGTDQDNQPDRGPLGRKIDLGITFVKLQCLGSVSGCTCLGWMFLSELLSKTKGDRVNNYFKSLNSKSICF